MGRIILPEVSASATPPSGKVSVYAKTDGQLYLKNDAGVESPVGGGGGGSGLPSGGSVGQLLSLDGSSNPFWIDRPPGIAKIVASGRLLPGLVAPANTLNIPAGSGIRFAPFFVTTVPSAYGMLRLRGNIKVEVQGGANGSNVPLPVSLGIGVGMFPTAGNAAILPYPSNGPSGFHMRQGTSNFVASSVGGGVAFSYCVDLIFTRSNIRALYDYNTNTPSIINTAGDATLLNYHSLVQREVTAEEVEVPFWGIPVANNGILNGDKKVMLALSQTAYNPTANPSDLRGDGGVEFQQGSYTAEWTPFPGTPDANNFGSFGSEIG